MYTTEELINMYDKSREYEKELDQKEKKGEISSEDIATLRIAVEFMREGNKEVVVSTINRADTMVRDLFAAMMTKEGNFVIDEW